MGNFDQNWNTPPSPIQLAPSEIHLWRVDLASSPTGNSPKEGLLSDDEIARAKKFHFGRDREAFVRARGALRCILARYVPYPPDKIRFFYQPNGKPELATAQNNIGLNFNLSHSGDLAIIGVTLGRRIGVDVERYRNLEFLEIARRYFSLSESRQLTALPPNELKENFFACWTRKEAFLKALGEGIGVLLPCVSVTVAQFESPKLIEFQGNADAPLHWSLTDTQVSEGYAAALAFERGPVKIQHYIPTE
ncbi:MAG TPA: 4'-phosphopantetheinyl transferase superfamily protein [Terriglobales bacterium]|nr:4'-phosphopantetheinyl transferase superfamily protein [Terriglobales bacterium]